MAAGGMIASSLFATVMPVVGIPILTIKLMYWGNKIGKTAGSALDKYKCLSCHHMWRP
jgi:hypothetical protein